jgi:hypothetical protein
MTLVNDILKQMPGLGQPQRKFLATFVTFQIQWRVFGHFIWWDGVVML